MERFLREGTDLTRELTHVRPTTENFPDVIKIGLLKSCWGHGHEAAINHVFATLFIIFHSR